VTVARAFELHTLSNRTRVLEFSVLLGLALFGQGGAACHPWARARTFADALGNPLGFFLTGGEAHDLVGADHLLPTMEADTLIADRAFDADERVLEPRPISDC
jgi:hypothetical protein